MGSKSGSSRLIPAAFECNVYVATALQVLAVLALLWLTRFFFYRGNLGAFGDISPAHLFRLAIAGLRFDVSAVAWCNALFIALRFLPFPFVYNKGYLIVTDVIFVATNLLMLVVNIIDIPLYPIFGFRLSWSSIAVFLREPTILSLMASFAVEYWWITLGILILLLLLIWLVVGIKPKPVEGLKIKPWVKYCCKTLLFLIAAFLTFAGMWGRALDEAPLYVEYAAMHAKKSSEINLVLNTPFTILKVEEDIRLPRYDFFSERELSDLRNSYREPDPALIPTGKNLVVITIESGGTIWNERLSALGKSPAPGLMPFLDSLIDRSLVFPNTIATSSMTVDGIRNVYAGMPAYGFFLISEVAFDDTEIKGLPALLEEEGYYSKFYLGSHRDSFLFYPFFVRSGFKEVTSLETLPPIKENVDDKWGYWDHALMEYAVRDLGTLPTPFVAGIMTLNPHEPYLTPEDWRENEYRYPQSTNERGVEYLDKTLETFFNEAGKQEWYDNTIFVITADHGARYDLNGEWGTPFVQPHILFLVYDPSGSIPAGFSNAVVGQFDIMPTLLSLLKFNRPYVSLGESVYEPGRKNYAFNVFAGGYHVIGDKYLVVLDRTLRKVESVYDITSDKTLRHPLREYDKGEVEQMKTWLQALLQDYSQRMYNNKMTATP